MTECWGGCKIFEQLATQERSLVLVVAYHIGAKPLPKPMLTYYESEPRERTSMTFVSSTIFLFKNVQWKCFLENGAHFIRAQCVKQIYHGFVILQDLVMRSVLYGAKRLWFIARDYPLISGECVEYRRQRKWLKCRLFNGGHYNCGRLSWHSNSGYFSMLIFSLR